MISQRPFGVAREPDHGAGPDPDRRLSLVAQGAGREFETVARDLRHLAVGEHRLDLRRGSVRHDGRDEPVAVVRLGKEVLQRGVALGGVLREAKVGFRAAIPVPVVIVDHAAPHRSISGFLVGLPDRGLHGQALGVSVLAVGVEDDLAGHFGDEFGVRGQDVAQSCADGQWRGLCFPELLGTDVLQIVHSS